MTTLNIIYLPGQEPSWKDVKVHQAAIKDCNGKIWTIERPGRHPDIMRDLIANKLSIHVRESDKGFLLTNGEFVNRKVAKIIAGLQNQLLSSAGSFEELFTEDLW